MANRNYPSQRVFSFNMLPVRVSTSFDVGSTGAVSNTDATHGIKSITRLAAGVYRAQLDDNYYAFINSKFSIKAPVAGSNVAATALTPGVVYEITALGTTTQANWVTAGVPSGITAAVGTVFVAAATSSGNGTAKIIGQAGITSIEIAGNPAQMLNNQPFIQGNGGGYITFQCNGPTSSSVTTPIATDPASGSKIFVEFMLNNSSVS